MSIKQPGTTSKQEEAKQTKVRYDYCSVVTRLQVQCRGTRASSAGICWQVLEEQIVRRESVVCRWRVGRTSLEQSAIQVLEAVCRTHCHAPRPNLQWTGTSLRVTTTTATISRKQEGLAVASIARDDPSPPPGMHRDHNAPAHAGALWAATTMRGKLKSEFET